MVIGIDPRNREFSVERLLAALGEIEAASGRAPALVYLDCDAAMLVRRYSETRRRHPLSPHGSPLVGIERERALLAALRDRADVLIDTSAMTPHELRAEMAGHFGEEGDRGGLAVTLQSFSYKRGVPRGADMVDRRALPAEPALGGGAPAARRARPGGARLRRARPGLCAVPRAARRARHASCSRPTGRRERATSASPSAAPAGGTGRWRWPRISAKMLATDGWRVSIRHRELERALDDAAAVGVGAV